MRPDGHDMLQPAEDTERTKRKMNVLCKHYRGGEEAGSSKLARWTLEPVEMVPEPLVPLAAIISLMRSAKLRREEQPRTVRSSFYPFSPPFPSSS